MRVAVEVVPNDCPFLTVLKYMLSLTIIVAMSCIRAAAGGTDAVAVHVLVAELYMYADARVSVMPMKIIEDGAWRRAALRRRGCRHSN